MAGDQARQLKVGDVVKLKSGGPSMTVCVQTARGWECSWFASESSTSAAKGEFPSEALEFLHA